MAPQNNLNNPVRETIDLKLRHKPMQRRIANAVVDLAEDTQRSRKMRLPRAPAPVAPRPLPPPATPPPAGNESLPYVLGEIDKMAQTGQLPYGAGERIRQKLALFHQQGGLPGYAKVARRVPMNHFLNRARQMGIDDTAGLAQAQAVHSYAASQPGLRRMLRNDEKADQLLNIVEGNRRWIDGEIVDVPGNLAQGGNIGPSQFRQPGRYEYDNRVIQQTLADLGERDLRLRHMGLAAGVGVGALTGMAAYDRLKTRHNFNRMVAEDPDLQRMDPNQVRKKYRTVAKFAPAITEDPFAAASTVKKLLEYDTIDPQTVQSLQQTQRDSRQGVNRLLGIFANATGLSMPI